MEDIRRLLMNQFKHKRAMLQIATWDICPLIQRKLEKSKHDARQCSCQWMDETSFEVDTANGDRKLVNIGAWECSCKLVNIGSYF
ncbi:hypothetical protein CJ030_MR0G005898 [Morella rubra]|uniref:Uncharacterized protein n=1 Tax=Morella rubra TaxID=262757 RepID=A0A6A1UKY0_9ROSI|nr:hypothetical protein CJ030_MR0G005898 [Morella rubra]